MKCSEHGIRVVLAPCARKGSRYTLLFESFAMLLMKAMPVENARKLVRASHTSMTRILQYWVSKAVDEDDLSEVSAICIDETSFKRGHSYVTIVSDAHARRVIDVEPGKDAGAIEKFSYKLEQKGGDCNNIKQVVCDMSGAYIKAKEMCFPSAKLIIDKFHVKQLMLKAMDKVRREEQGGGTSRRRDSGKKLLMIPQTRQTEQQQLKVLELSKQYPKTGRAFRMVQSIDEMYKCSNIKEAENVFERMISWLRHSRLTPMKDVATTLKKHKQSILAYFYHRMTNAIAEGINSLIQSAKRRARGFRTIEGYTAMIYLVVGKLNLACPLLFT